MPKSKRKPTKDPVEPDPPVVGEHVGSTTDVSTFPDEIPTEETGEIAPAGSYKCPECAKEFKTQRALTGHQLSHLKDSHESTTEEQQPATDLPFGEDTEEESVPEPDLYDDFERVLRRLGASKPSIDKVVALMEDEPLDDYFKLEQALTRVGLKFQVRASILTKWSKIAGRPLPRQLCDEYSIDTESYQPPRASDYYGSYRDRYQSQPQSSASQLLDAARAMKELREVFAAEEPQGDYDDTELEALRLENEKLAAKIANLEQKAEFQKMLDAQRKEFENRIKDLEEKSSSKDLDKRMDDEAVSVLHDVHETARSIRDWLVDSAKSVAAAPPQMTPEQAKASSELHHEFIEEFERMGESKFVREVPLVPERSPLSASDALGLRIEASRPERRERREEGQPQ